MTQAQSSLEFIPPAYSPVVWQVAKEILPFWLRYNRNIIRVEVDRAGELIDLYQQFQQGKMRFMLAFRHPTVIDPPCLAQLLWNQLPRLARQQGVTLRSPVHAHFIYDRGIPLWAGTKVGWGISQLGGTPIRRGAVDRAGLRSIRDLFINGQFPLAAAPEGATNGHNEIVSPIEPGIAQFGFWCQEDLIKAERDEAVAIAPVGIKYVYQTAPWQYLDRLLAKLEVDSGLLATSNRIMGLINGQTPNESQQTELYQRLVNLAEHLLSLMEDFYRKYYQQQLETSEDFSQRLQALLDAALKVAEQSFGIKSNGTISDRCRRVEQAGWNRIYREDISELVKVKGLADLVASEAELRLWHMRLVETFVSVTGYYVAENLSAERFADTIILLWTMVAKLKGSKVKTPYLGQKKVKLTAMPPFLIADYWEQYQTNRRQAVADLTQNLQQALEETVSNK
jgi:hypothetical protein